MNSTIVTGASTAPRTGSSSVETVTSGGTGSPDEPHADSQRARSAPPFAHGRMADVLRAARPACQRRHAARPLRTVRVVEERPLAELVLSGDARVEAVGGVDVGGEEGRGA